MRSSGISFNICLKNISGRLAKNGFKRDRDGFPVRKRVRDRDGFPVRKRVRDRDGFRPVGTGSGSGRKNFVPPDPIVHIIHF
jgi:hypothetical protein